MLILDQLSRGEKEVRTISVIVLSGLLLLVVVLWHLQIFSSGKYVQRLEQQAYRTVREPAVRGEIFDRNGVVMAASRPAYNINLYVRELSKSGLFGKEYRRLKKLPEYAGMSVAERSRVARFNVASQVVTELGSIVGVALQLNEEKFQRHYEQTRALPMCVMGDVSQEILARFMESPVRPVGVGMESEVFRQYPLHEGGGHILGFLLRRQIGQEDIEYSYQMPDFVGKVGIEGAFDKQLRGLAGAKNVLVDNTGYRQEENEFIIPVAGQDLFLTVDTRIQAAAEKALRSVGANAKGAVVVMNVRNGDILAMASVPSYDPNLFIPRISQEQWAIYNDTETMPTLCRASYGAYAPGSIFKVVVGLAALEAGVDPEEKIWCDGYYQIGKRRINDTAPAGEYNFRRAFMRSSNAYFIEEGLKIGLDRLLDMGARFFLGQKTGIPTYQEVSGFFPSKQFVTGERGKKNVWKDGHTANLCIGQGDITVTPLQMAVVTSAIANGGTVFWPRLVMRLETRDPLNKLPGVEYQEGRLRGNLGVASKSLKVLQDAMLGDVEDPEGTGKSARVKGMRVCGKTGTAEVKKGNTLVRKDTWFISYAPYERPLYAVVVLVEGGGSGGRTCAPVARQVYEKIHAIEMGQWKGRG